MPKYISPLRYPGGKACIAPFISDIIVNNGLIDGSYAEPYCGGAAVGLHLLTNELVHNIYLNDADRRIWAFWYSILYDTERFLRLLKDIPINISQWKIQKDISKRQDSTDILLLGFSTFYLNRCNRSGILKGGPIGGFHQSGFWHIDARFQKKELTQRIEFLANYSNRIKISNLDALVFLKKLEKERELTKKLVIYLDPPYFSMGNFLYMNYYKEKDHEKLAKYVRSTKLKWILSYDDVQEIRKLYDGMPIRHAILKYHANVSKIGRELLFFHPSISIP